MVSRVDRQFQCAGNPAVAQGVGDELGHDQDHGSRDFRGNGRLPQVCVRCACCLPGCLCPCLETWKAP